MVRRRVSLALLVGLACCARATAPQPDAVAGSVHYRLGGGQRGVLGLLFAEGRSRVEVQAHFTNPGLARFPPVRLGYVESEGKLTTYDLETRRGERAAKEYAPFGLFGQISRGNLRVYDMRAIVAADGIRVGVDEVAGLPCERWRFGDPEITVCLHRGVMLASSTRVAGQEMTVTAVRATLDTTPPSAVALPADVQIAPLTLEEISRRKGVEGPTKETFELLPKPD